MAAITFPSSSRSSGGTFAFVAGALAGSMAVRGSGAGEVVAGGLSVISRLHCSTFPELGKTVRLCFDVGWGSVLMVSVGCCCGSLAGEQLRLLAHALDHLLQPDPPLHRDEVFQAD